MWKAFGCEILGDYHDLYLKTDACSLADVFENLTSLCLKQYGLDPDLDLELLTDVDVHLFIEQGTRGGISMVSKRFAKANNAYVKDQAVCVTRFDQSECVICRVIFALGKSRFQRYMW